MQRAIGAKFRFEYGRYHDNHKYACEFAPELKDKVAPLINELIKGLEITLSGMVKKMSRKERADHRGIKKHWQ